MANVQAPRDDNYIPTMLAKDNSTGETRPILVDSVTGRILTDATGTATGQQYTEGDTDTTITGSVAMGEAPSDTVQPLQLDASNNLKISIEADNAGIGGGTQYADNAVEATPTGTVALGHDGSNVRALATDSDGDLQIDVKSSSLPTGAATAANQSTIIGHVDGIEGLLTTIDSDTGSISTNTGTTATNTGTIATNTGTTASNTTAILADTASIDTNMATVAGAVSGTEMQVDVLTMPTTTIEPDGTALSNGQASVDTTVGGSTIIAASAGRQGVTITNQGSVDCYIGTGTVSTSNGFLLAAGESIALPTDSEVKGITASSSTTIGYLAFA